MYRIAVILVDVQQLDYVEAAAVMGVPKGVLKCFLSFGRVRILQGYYQSLQRAKCHETYLRITNI
jgi:DNA-directed RNA polymerase specialized sigma24 family protein